MVQRGLAVYKDKGYISTFNGHRVALNAATGEVVWDVVAADYTASEAFTAMDLPLKGMIINGTVGAEYGTRLWMEARDAETGELIWKTYSVPGPGEPGNETWPGDTWKYGGGSYWVTASYDKEQDCLFWGVGNPGPDFYRGGRIGDNLWTDSVLKLDATTGKMLAGFQFSPNDPYDYDSVQEDIIADVPINGEMRKVIIHCNRNGYFYVLDRVTVKPIYAIPYVDINWTKTDQGNYGLDENFRPIQDWPKMDVKLDEITYDIRPAQFGAKNVHPGCYNPNNYMGYWYAVQSANNIQGEETEWKRGQWYLGLAHISYPVGYGTTTAIDVSKGEIVWEYTDKHTVFCSQMVTGGGLVFTGNGIGEFKALDDMTGEELWSFNCGSGLVGKPVTYMIDGVQYVAMSVGWGGWVGWSTMGPGVAPHIKDNPKAGYLIVFALHDRVH
jgi:alcohol dehydrogenase (cytochrome c)